MPALPIRLLLCLLLFPTLSLAAPPSVDLDPANAGGLSPDVALRFLEGSAPVPIAPSAEVNDPDGDATDELVLELSPAFPEDRLEAQPGDTGIGVNWDGTTLRLVGPASTAAFQRVLRTATFSAAGRNPDPTPRDISVTVVDGAEVSAPVSAVVSIQTVNDPPSLDLNPSTEGRDHLQPLPAPPAAVSLCPDAVVSDIDDDVLRGASVERIAGAPGDALSATAAGTGVTVAAEANGDLRLTGEAPVAVYQELLRSLRMAPADADADRVVAVTVSDGRRESRVSVAVVARDVTDPPEVVTTTFTENGDPVAVAGTGATLTDPSGDGFTALTITLANIQPGDVLRANTEGTAIVQQFSDGVLRLTGADDAAAYTSALRSVTFLNPSDTPSTERRILTFQVRTGERVSPVATTILSVLPLNDAPALTLPPPQVTPRNVPLLFSRVEGNAITVSDPDAGSGAVTLSLFVPRGTLTAEAGNGAEISGAGTREMTVTGTLADVNAALNGLRYDPPPDWQGTTSLTVTANDRGHTGAPGPAYDQESVEITVAVTTVPDPPEAVAGPDQRVNEGDRVDLNGAASFARVGALVAFSWEQVAGPAATLSGSDTATPFFTAPPVGGDTLLRFRLTATDSEGGADADEVAVIVTDTDVPGPGDPDLAVEEGRTATLPAGMPVDGATGYRWEQVSGPAAPLSDPEVERPSFVAPAVGPDGAELVFRETVFRGGEEPVVREVVVVVGNNGIAGFPDDVLTYRSAADVAMGIRVSRGDLVRLEGVDPARIDDRRGRPLGFPFGLTSLEIRMEGPGRRAEITFFLPAPAPPGDRWFKHDPAVGWYEFGGTFSEDRRRVTIDIGDGSRGDVDGVANGLIVDPSGLATPSGLPPSPGLDGDADGDGGGCFLGATAAGR